MLKPVRPSSGLELPIGQADYPVPFAWGLEFNPPAHGGWNIVHIGMQLPQAHQIYVCAANCMRGVVLTAAEMNASDRFSMVILEESDLCEGTVEDITIEGTADAIRKLPQRPPAVLLFTVCIHHFLGCDYEHIYGELGRLFPDIAFIRCFMDPIMQKGGITPDQKLRRSMTELLPLRPVKKKTAALLGSDFRLNETCELKQIFSESGWSLHEIQDCKTFEEYLSLGECELFVTVYPNGVLGVEQVAKRLGRDFLYLPQCFGYEEICTNLEKLGKVTGNNLKKNGNFPSKCDELLRQTRELLGTTPIFIDPSLHPRPLGLARLLLEHDFCVKKVYLDAVSSEEEIDFYWLKAHHPSLLLSPIIRPEMRLKRRGDEEKVLALGQKAAWFENTPYFVNIVQGGSLWGFDGIMELCRLMQEAFLYEKETQDIIPRKGLGCESCV